MITKLLEFNLESLKKDLFNYLIDGKYLYHYTLTEYVDNIKNEGIIPRKTQIVTTKMVQMVYS